MEAKKKKIYFRADADGIIGYGHFMRTLALAEVLSDYYDCVFATQSPSAFQRDCLKDVCSLMELPSDDSRFEIFLGVVKSGDIVVLDNYFYNSSYENLLRGKGATVVLIDNLHKRHSCADVIIGFLLGLNVGDYSVESYTKLFLGPGYSLLRKPFLEQLNIKHPLKNDAKPLKVVISFGGADSNGIAISIANILEPTSSIGEITVIGKKATGLIDSAKIVFKRKLSASEMRDAFINNDIAILPASTTTLEALACGIPIIGGYFTDNQVNSYNQYVKANAIFGCGNLIEKANQIRVREIIEGNMIWKDYLPQSIIPLNVKQNILSIFNELSDWK